MAAGSVATSDFDKGRDIYNFRCYFCHGYAGDAKTLASTYLSPPPRDFTSTPLDKLSRQRMIRSVTQGRKQTGMVGFDKMLTEEEIVLVVDFVRQAFMGEEKLNTRYHIAGNGWPNHEQYAIAFPFATGEIALDTPAQELTGQQLAGRQLFMESCITCHDRARVEDEGVPWRSRPVSIPRTGYSHRNMADAVSSATPYSRHDIVPRIKGLDGQQQEGETLFQKNCAFCHAADGTGKNWIGMFMEPPARDLTAMAGLSRERLKDVIRDGLPDTSMPAWRHVLTSQQIEAVAAYVMRVFVPRAASRAE